MPIVPAPPRIYDRFTIKQPFFYTTMHGTVDFVLFELAKEILHSSS